MNSHVREIALALVRCQRVDVNKRLHGGYAPLYFAIRRKNWAVFEALLGRPDLDLRARSPLGCGFLHFAAKDPEMTRALLAKRVIDVNAVNAAGETALHKAAFAGCVEVVSLLLEQPEIDPNIANAQGAPLTYALTAGQEQAALLLIEDPRTDINRCGLEFGPLIRVVVVCNSARCLQACFKKSGFSFPTDGKEFTKVLMFATRHRRGEMIHILLMNCGIRIGKGKCGEKKVLEQAKQWGFDECAQVLNAWLNEKHSRSQAKKKSVKRFTFLQKWRRRALTADPA
jgi:ankyrin repeat protein